MHRAIAGLMLTLLALTGCDTMKIEDFAEKEPRFRLEEYFAGRSRAWGLFEDRFGNLRREFVVDIVGTWDGDTLTLEEDFRYADGEEDRRVWRISKLDEHRYEGRAEDIVGTAQGASYGNALNWSYQLDLPVGDNTWRVSFDDWMFLQPGGVLLNRAEVTKWGIELGTVIISFMKLPEDAAGNGAGGGDAVAVVTPRNAAE